MLIHDTHADIITIQETKLTPKGNTPKVHNFTTVRANRLYKAGGGLITLIRDNITFTTTDTFDHQYLFIYLFKVKYPMYIEVRVQLTQFNTHNT